MKILVIASVLIAICGCTSVEKTRLDNEKALINEAKQTQKAKKSSHAFGDRGKESRGDVGRF